MVEVLEYALTVLVSSLLVSGSVVVYDSFATYQSQLQLKAAWTAVSALASKAVAEGSSQGTLVAPSSTIACVGGTLNLTLGASNQARTLPVTCSFRLNLTAGTHVLSFTDRSSSLNLSVT